MNEALINDYAARLRAALYDEATFEAIYAELDGALDVAEAKKLCRTFYGGSARSKSDALGKIWSCHGNLRGAKARADAIGGRLAG